MKRGKSLLILLTAFLLAASCSKKDILPEAIGEPVPYTPEATRNWEEVMNDAEFNLFKTAYNRSVLADRIKATNSVFHTIFMPTNTAFENAGWTLDKINATTPEQLDSLLAFYVVTGRYTREALQAPQPRNYPLNTLLTNATLPGTSSRAPYQYRLRIGNWNDSLTLNGRSIMPWSSSEDVLNGYVFKITKLVPLPTMSLIDYLKSQPRFSMLLEAINASPHYYELANWEGNYGHDPDFIIKLTNNTSARHTIFAPTNRAFANSGFHTIEDINNRIEASLPIQPAHYDEDNRYQYPSTAMDSLLRAHGFAALSSNPYDAVFYYKDLQKSAAQLTGFLIHPSSPYQSKKTIIETSFVSDNDQVTIGSFRSSGPRQPIVEADIECYNGVIHVVDDFIMNP